MKLLNVISNPFKIISFLSSRISLKWIPDEVYLKMLFRARMGKKLNIKNPLTYNEKLQWLKINDKNPLYTNLVDKYEVRTYISNLIGEEYLIPIYGVYNSFEEIDFETLPNQFVIKCTHDSGGVVICKDKSKFNKEEAAIKLNKSLKTNYFWKKREYPYKDITPRIICEKLMVDESGIELKDYKFFCFDGEPKAMFIATDRQIDTRFDFFDMEFNHLPVSNHYENSTKKLKKPLGFDEMISLSKRLSKEMPHVRVDFYDINGKIYFGELTFYHFSGFEKFEPEKYDRIFGDWLNIEKKENRNGK
ncbi:ATP-grasp fold amidoligase family protein [Bacillus sp. CFBP9009]